MALDPARLAEIIDRVANSLQTAAVLAARLEPDVRQSSRDAADLHQAITMAAAAIRELRPDDKGQL